MTVESRSIQWFILGARICLPLTINFYLFFLFDIYFYEATLMGLIFPFYHTISVITLLAFFLLLDTLLFAFFDEFIALIHHFICLFVDYRASDALKAQCIERGQGE